MDTFKNIEKWAKLFGLPVNTEKKFPSLTDIEFCLELIDEEKEELTTAIVEQNLTEVQDALGDLLWVTVRAMNYFGIDPHKTMESICQSNMSKSDSNWEDAELTKNKYLREGILTFQEEHTVDGETRICTYRKSDGKLLKSINFIEPKFD